MNNSVSICVPVYNAEKYLKRCVDSLLNQTYRNLEIVLVNDGSTDSCGLICDEYARLDSRVVVVHKDNGGEASARNAGLRAAKGDYIMFIDNDDEYLPNAVELLIDAIKSDEVDLVLGGYIERRGEIEHFATGHLRKYSAKEVAHDYLSSDCNHGIIYIISTVNGKLFRHEIISVNSISFDERFVVGNDMVFNCEYLKHTRTVYNLFAPIYIYYKFHPTERVQQTALYYPDTFFVFAYVADKMIKIAQLDENEFKQLVTKQYKDFLYGLVNATANKDRFNNGITTYLTSFCNEIDLLQIGAKLDLTEDYIKKEDGALPIRLMSYLIFNKRFDELFELLKVMAKQRKIIPYQGDTVRQMITLKPQPNGNYAKSTASESFGYLGFDDKMLIEQINELVTTIAANERQIDAQKAEIDAQKAEIDAQKSKIYNFVTSNSWRVTKPLRAIRRYLRKK